MTVTYGQTTVRLAHRVRLRHAVTGATITAVDAALPARPEGWTCRVRDGEAIVTVRDHSPTPDAPVEVLLTVTDGRLKDLLTLPAPAPGDPPMTVRVALAAEVAAVDVPPAPLTLVVDLVERPSGDPATGRTLGVRASSGPDPKPTIALTESAPGTYEAVAATWTAAYLPADLLVDGSLLRQVAVDFDRTTTRVHAVDTT